MDVHGLAPVLLVGGSGVVGREAARALRRMYPNLRLGIGGRDAARAAVVAEEVGVAEAVPVDLTRADLGLSAGSQYSAVVMFVKDDTLNSLRYAQRAGIAHVGISTGVHEVGPEVAEHARRPHASPVVLASSWLVGAATLPVLHFAREFRRLDSVAITGVLDEQDMGGPAAFADYERLTSSAAQPLQLRDGRWVSVTGADATRTVSGVDGVAMEAHAYSPFDVLSLAAATEARSVRFDWVYGESSARRAGGPFSTEIILELHGERHDGTVGTARHELVHPAGQAPVTALLVALLVERLLGLTGEAPVAPGLYLVDGILDPAAVMERMAEAGMRIGTVTPATT